MIKKIIADSSADILALDGVNFENVPLTLIIDGQEIHDDQNLDLKNLKTKLKATNDKTSTSCPNVHRWQEAFGDADEVYGVTITSQLSGSYNAAQQATSINQEEKPNQKIFMLDSKSAGPEMGLLVEKMAELIKANWSFEEISAQMTAYHQRTHLAFALEDLTNLARNGRVNGTIAKLAGMLGIRMVGRASDKGDLESVGKARGAKKAIRLLLSEMEAHGFDHGRAKIGHNNNPDGAQALASAIRAAHPKSQVDIVELRGLCSYYAEEGGLMVGYEG